MKRIFLFVVVNLAVVFVLTLVYHLLMGYLGPQTAQQLAADGLDYPSLASVALVFGMGGALISLLMSKPMAKWSVGAQIVDGTENAETAWLVRTVERLSERANLKCPEVAVYSGEPNAFATGAFRNHALVAVSTGILETMKHDELEAVLGHEISHVANGDMVTLTLVQGVLNACVIALARIIAYAVENAMGEKNRRRGNSGIYVLVVYLMQFVLGIFASLIVCAYSRRREYAADAGSARLLGSPMPMIAALRRLAAGESGVLPDTLKAFGVSGSRASLFATHPSIEDRIEALMRNPTGV